MIFTSSQEPIIANKNNAALAIAQRGTSRKK